MIFDKLFKKIEIRKPVYPVLFSFETQPYGTGFECLKNGRMKRPAQIKKMKVGDPVTFELSKWYNETILLVVNSKGVDVGSYPEPFYKYLTGLVKNPQISGTVTSLDPFTINVEVRGEYKRAWEFADTAPGERGKEYEYNVNTGEDFMCLPTEEIPCQLVLVEDTYTVKAAGRAIGTISPKRTEKLKKMLDQYNCTTTLRLEPHYYDGSVRMVLRF